MRGPFRLPQGGHVDRAETLSFRFDGRIHHGHPGDTLASALLAGGVRLFGRSFKYHRPRGLFTAGPEEPSALVELRSGARREPNIPATTIELFEGLEARSQNRWPCLGFDVGAVNNLLSRFLPAGFYYKTFMWPPALWERLYEPLIRRAAGLGRAAAAPDPDRYDTLHAHCDVLVVGSGPAGLAKALEAARGGARVMLLEQDFAFGGSALVDPAGRDGLTAALGELSTLPDVTLLNRTTAFGLYDGLVVGAVERVSDHLAAPGPRMVRQRQWIIRPGRIVLATGALERLIAFPGNDRPGVMLASAAAAYVARFGVAPGRRAVFFVNNDQAYRPAMQLREAGVEIAGIVDIRPDSAAGRVAADAGVPVWFGSQVVGTEGAPLHVVTVAPAAGGRPHMVLADLLCVSGGYNPQIQLASQARLPLQWDAASATFLAAGGAGIELAGDAAGLAAPATPLQPLWEVRPAGRSGKAFVDLQHDVTAEDLRLAHREGYRHVEHAKRYTTAGMATDQGRSGGLVASAILAEARGESVAAVGLPTFRPYAAPVSFGALAGAETGDHFRPKRRLPLHDWHARRGAVFVRLGLWLRPLVYSAARDTSWAPVLAEARAVRGSAGLTDTSSLGKIDVQGADAAVFLDRIYANTVSTLPVGRARYGLMLREDGIVFDDGTVSRLAADHFFLTTTTANAGAAIEHLEFHHQTAWPDLDVQIANVADQWAQFAVAGPMARAVLAGLVGLDLDDAAFPFMAVAETRIAGVAGRLFRISFSGELAYEVSVPAGYAEPVWEAILAAGEPFGIAPYALDALNLLRIEKGHVAGSELNGQTTAADLGLGRMAKKQGDFIGRALSARPGLADPDRPVLVGVKVEDPHKRLRAGALLLPDAEARESLGFVTAACPATEDGGFIGLALLAAGAGRIGARLRAADPVRGEACDVTIVAPHFVDPGNLRVRDASPAPKAAAVPWRAPSPGLRSLIPDRASDRSAQVRLAEYSPDIAELTARRGSEGALRRALLAEFGLALPGPGRATTAGPLRALSVAPRSWLVIDMHAAPGGLAVSLKHAVGEAGSVVDQSFGYGVLRLSGPRARAALSKGCRLDLHPRSFGQQSVARSIVAQVPVLVYQVDDQPSYDLFAPSTLAQSFADFLVESAAEYGLAFSDSQGNETP
ncbi:2Fe-2S iron-sulfur cluster-binding protein [Labrys monachus]|uniref:Sarcosine oxidase subunit alpha n=1 Tax=Labrys monachus TaxID=217067 RepID=A0ABU0F859_9HYPH|nr:2Fe-2S iron-sulfur cluster-binding protein [Labrys monachus]MDQ0390726.1 sarcosine oxidase subunit alpha [Labrys monachus]